MAAVCLYTGPCPLGWEVYINKWSCGWHHFILFFSAAHLTTVFHIPASFMTVGHAALSSTHYFSLHAFVYSLGACLVFISWKSIVSILLFYILPVISVQSLF